MSSVEEIKELLNKHKDEIKEKYGVVILGIFGSYARQEADKASDVLVEIEKPIGLKFFELWDEKVKK